MLPLWSIVGFGILQRATSTTCGCDICNVQTEVPWYDDTSSPATWSSANWSVIDNDTVVCSSPELQSSTLTNTSCCIDRNKSYKVHFQPADFWENAGSLRIDGDTVAGNVQRSPTSFPRSSPFQLLSGHECDIAGTCIFSSRRRVATEQDFGQGGDCEVAVDNRTGPFKFINITSFKEEETLIVNGVSYFTTGNDKKVPSTAVRPLTNIVVQKNGSPIEERLRKKSKWAICTQPLLTSRETSATPTTAPTPSPSSSNDDAVATRLYLTKAFFKDSGTCENFPKTKSVCDEAATKLGFGVEVFDNGPDKKIKACKLGYYGLDYGFGPGGEDGAAGSGDGSAGGGENVTAGFGHGSAGGGENQTAGYEDSESSGCSFGCFCINANYVGESVVLVTYEQLQLYESPNKPFSLPQQPKEVNPTSFRGVCMVRSHKHCRGKKLNYTLSEASLPTLGNVSYYPVDWDRDGDIDLLLGRRSGDLVYLENTNGTFDISKAVGLSKGPSGATCERYWYWEEEMMNCDNWCCFKEGRGDICLTRSGSIEDCQRAGAWGVSLETGLHPVPVDWDRDGDLDLVAGSCNGKVYLFRNTSGSGPFELSTGSDDPFAGIDGMSGLCVYPDVADWDGDGDYDVLLGLDTGIVEYYENVGGHLQQRTGDKNPFKFIQSNTNAVPVAVDMDGDGDLDLLVGSGASVTTPGKVNYFERNGHGILISHDTFAISNLDVSYVPRAADLNGDKYPDLIIFDDQQSTLRIYWSQIDNKLRRYEWPENPFEGLTVEARAVPQAVDWDGDGHPEFFAGGPTGELTQYTVRADGMVKDSVPSVLQGLPQKKHVVQQVVDWDHDGDQDLIVGGEGGDVIFYERDTFGSLSTQGLELVAPNPNHWVSPHAVDWDGDGLLDLLLGDSGPVVARTVTLSGFYPSVWNTAFTEILDPETFIGDLPVFVTDPNWVLAFCANMFWFIFQNDTDETWQLNRAGKCSGAVAKTDGATLGKANKWFVTNPERFPANTKKQLVIADGSAAKPYCDPCTNRGDLAECGTCSLSGHMVELCTSELCEASKLFKGFPKARQSVPAIACACQDLPGRDVYGATCGQYTAAWCGRYDDSVFISGRDCCVCGGGAQKNASLLQKFAFQAECNKQEWFNSSGETISISPPSDIPSASVRFFQRTDKSPLSFTEVSQTSSSNPFRDINASTRPYPFVIDWNLDGRLDLVLGSSDNYEASFKSQALSSTSACCQPEGLKVADCKKLADEYCKDAGYLRAFSVANCEIESGIWAMTVHCRNEGGTIRYFEGDGPSLTEQLGTANPFHGIDAAGGTAIPFVSDWDADGDLEVIVSGTSNALGYYRQGEGCMLDPTCNQHGLCQPVLGTCSCTASTTMEDCSRCNEHYVTERSTSATPNSCRACPGVGTLKGACSGRGICADDAYARQTSTFSEYIKAFEAGNGTCLCSPHFTGDDCKGGMCPAGMAYVEGVADVQGAPSICVSCEQGYFKASAGDTACEKCPAGKLAAAVGATSCESCPAGSFQAEAGSSKCYECQAGKASPSGSTSCTVCGVGTYAHVAGLGSCAPCSPGSWSSGTGAEQCTKCAAGEYSSGAHACKQCPSGSFSDTPGEENCTLCDAGTYSSTSGGNSKEVCIPCDVGKYGSDPGQPRESSCIPCSTGATTLRRGSTSADSCIEPNPMDYVCTSGHYCSINVTGNGLVGHPHRVAIMSSSGNLLSDASSTGQDYRWPKALSFLGGVFSLKWCAGVHKPCDQIEDFNFDLGQLLVTGPSARQDWSCVRGKTCVNLGPVPGRGLAGLQSSIQVMAACEVGPELALGEGNRFAQVAVDDGNLTFGFGNGPVTADPDKGYAICWCALGQEKGCSSTSDFLTFMGSLAVEGPKSGQERQCSLGQDCALRGITGVNLAPGDRIMVMDNCGTGGQAIPGVPSGGIAEASTGGDVVDFHFSGEKVLQSFPGIYRICFCRPVLGSTSCSVPADFLATVGLFTAQGPYPEQNIGCFLGATCTLAGIRGIGLVDKDEVLIQETCGQNGSQVPVGLPKSAILATDGGTNFTVGPLTNAKTGQYSVCWRPVGGRAFGTKIGALFVACPAGKYGLDAGCELCPFGHYCTGGTPFANYKDDTLTRCPDAGSTTALNGSVSVTDCKCRPGYKKATNCILCEAGRYKAVISNDAACPGQCLNGTTSRPGASAAALCYNAAMLQGQRLDEALVFVLAGNLTMKVPACGHRAAEQELRMNIAAQLALAESRVEVTVKPHASCAPQAAGARRLQAAQPPASSEASFRIMQGSEDKAERLRLRLNFKEMQANLPNNVVIVESGENSFFITTETLTCPENKAFPLGTSVESLEQCTCSLGYFQGNSGLCEACALGSYKGDVGSQACSVCVHQMVNGQDVALTTLAVAATIASNCTCPAGYYSKASSTECHACPKGSYCTGGEHMLPCPPGSTTLSTRTGNIIGCVCDKGQTQTTVRNATHRCQPCPAQFYKDAIGDVECSQSCPQYSTSNPGATGRSDCYCLAGFFSDPTIGGTCQLCPAEGVHCAGNFTPAGSRNHTEPAAKDGYYLTGFSTAEECVVQLEGGASACLQGATFKNHSGACAGSQTGMLCGACQHLSARDLGDQPCSKCDDKLADWMLVATIIADVSMKAGFGMFLGKQAMSDGMEVAKTDSVILRILLQWITAMSVLQTTDLSGVTLYDWSQEALVKQNAAEEATASTFASATGLSFKFDFPKEFQPIFNALMAVKGSIPSPQSPQQSLECLVQRHLTPTDMPPQMQLLVPALFWLTYPLFVLVAAYIFCIIFVKCIWPILMWLAVRAKKKLRKLLLAAGAAPGSVDAALANLNQDAALELLGDPSALTTVEGLKQYLGDDVCHEVAASAFAQIMGTRINEKIEEVIALDDVEEERRNALSVVRHHGDEGLRRLLAKLLGVMDTGVFTGSLLHPHSAGQEAVARAFEESIEEMDVAELSALVSSCNLQEAGGTGAPPTAAEDAPAVEVQEVVQEYGILGIFRERSSCRTIIVDAWPLMLVTLYSVWDTITRRFLGLMQVKRILVEEPSASSAALNVPQIQGRWLYDTRFQVFHGDHFWVGFIGVLGLLIWSVGFLAVIFRQLRKNRHQLQDFQVLRTYGYFYNGLEPTAYWWEVVAKKFDILCLYFVTFADLFHDPKAKLIMYLGFAGVFWAFHNVYHPFDNRHNSLADRLEGFGLTVRFVSLFLLQCLLLMNADIVINAIAASFILLIIISFLVTATFVLLIEMTSVQARGGDDDAGDEVQDKVSEKADGAGENFSKMIVGKSTDPVRQALAKVVSFVFGLLLGKLFELIMKAAAFISSVRESVDREVPNITWQGPNANYLLMEPKRDRRSWPRRLLAIPLRFVYRLDKEEQWSYLADTLGSFLAHFVTSCECRELPPRILDIVLTLPGALAIEQADDSTERSLHVRTALRIHETVESSRQAQTSSAEELVKALFWLQHLSQEETQEFLSLASQTGPDFEPTPTPPATSSAVRLGVASV